MIKTLNERDLIKFLKKIGRQDLIEIVEQKGLPDDVRKKYGTGALAIELKISRDVTFGEYEITYKGNEPYLKITIKRILTLTSTENENKSLNFTIIEVEDKCDPSQIP
ncbi:hypothetical protein HOF78_03990 [Candidatus Woesearchaeota archaeon]|jgi:hypothetical protein|nr:hypothetical protein [Candidatus Woesearchaeota archaeon]MBT6044477.1 hypothetical protein [Candidatus Woesearchaeota archaeon]